MEMKAGLDFKIREVARATSAAPGFLPGRYHTESGLASGVSHWGLDVQTTLL